MVKKLIYIEWGDAFSKDCWQTAEELDEWKEQKFIVKQSGFVYAETKEYIILVGGINPLDKNNEEQYKQCIKIPKSWIGKRIDLTKHIK